MIARIRSVLSRIVSSVQAIGPALWPPALNAIRYERAAACRTTAATSSADDRVHDRGRPLVDVEVPRLPRDVPAIVARQDHVAGEAAAELAKVGGVGHRTGA